MGRQENSPPLSSPPSSSLAFALFAPPVMGDAWAIVGDDIVTPGLQRRQMFIMTSKVVSRDMKDANVYDWQISTADQLDGGGPALPSAIDIPIALGMTMAVIFFSRVLTSAKGSTSYSSATETRTMNKPAALLITSTARSLSRLRRG